jgi:hypothetical protein
MKKIFLQSLAIILLLFYGCKDTPSTIEPDTKTKIDNLRAIKNPDLSKIKLTGKYESPYQIGPWDIKSQKNNSLKKPSKYNYGDLVSLRGTRLHHYQTNPDKKLWIDLGNLDADTKRRTKEYFGFNGAAIGSSAGLISDVLNAGYSPDSIVAFISHQYYRSEIPESRNKGVKKFFGDEVFHTWRTTPNAAGQTFVDEDAIINAAQICRDNTSTIFGYDWDIHWQWPFGWEGYYDQLIAYYNVGRFPGGIGCDKYCNASSWELDGDVRRHWDYLNAAPGHKFQFAWININEGSYFDDLFGHANNIGLNWLLVWGTYKNPSLLYMASEKACNRGWMSRYNCSTYWIYQCINPRGTYNGPLQEPNSWICIGYSDNGSLIP